MKSDRPIDDADALSSDQWMDGLAGRPGGGAEHAEGVRIRSALAPEAQDRPVAAWQDIEARARSATTLDAMATQANPPALAGKARPGEAANDSRPLRWLGWAAALLLGLGLATLMPPPGSNPDLAQRGVTGQGSHGPQWLVERPLQAAEALATELRGLQAEATVTSEGDAVILNIRAQPGAMNAVNARLASLETGLDAEGRLRLVVLPIR